ncbi:hypothetical protein BV898_19431 [Hypsibius exemplaris]|uniref:Uncharacterized protein n=1 Tax=Hypsibius exemplaris TaxID=2072580 RepID=A0A9X6NQP0_HYPEX|nr:hypothetical protein BV898_19431 [Hypsibius exemplaris]
MIGYGDLLGVSNSGVNYTSLDEVKAAAERVTGQATVALRGRQNAEIIYNGLKGDDAKDLALLALNDAIIAVNVAASAATGSTDAGTKAATAAARASNDAKDAWNALVALNNMAPPIVDQQVLNDAASNANLAARAANMAQTLADMRKLTISAATAAKTVQGQLDKIAGCKDAGALRDVLTTATDAANAANQNAVDAAATLQRVTDANASEDIINAAQALANAAKHSAAAACNSLTSAAARVASTAANLAQSFVDEANKVPGTPAAKTAAGLAAGLAKVAQDAADGAEIGATNCKRNNGDGDAADKDAADAARDAKRAAQALTAAATASSDILNQLALTVVFGALAVLIY